MNKKDTLASAALAAMASIIGASGLPGRRNIYWRPEPRTLDPNSDILKAAEAKRERKRLRNLNANGHEND